MHMNKAAYSLVAGLVFLFIQLLSVSETGHPSDASLFFGRFHPLLVHLPIGILLIAALLELVTRLQWWGTFNKAVTALLFVGAWSAILAAIAGLYLAQGGGYDPPTLLWHKRLGVVIAILASATYPLKVWTNSTVRPPTKALKRGYAGSVAALVFGIALAGHFGGELTHGDGYLTRYMPDGIRNLVGLPDKEDIGRLQLDDPSEATTYAALIQPILDSRCIACHRADLAKGGLMLDTPEGLIEGGDDGPVIIAGRAEESELIHRIWLPLTSGDHMPPADRPQVTVAEAEMLRWWINQGASLEETLAEAEMTDIIQTILDEIGLDEIRTGIFALDISPPDSQDVAALASLGVVVTPLAEEEPFLQVRCTDPEACGNDEELAPALRALSANIAWLDLGRTEANDALLATIADLPHLTRLHLEKTAVTDAGLPHLGQLEYLEYLNLYGTAVGDDGLQHLSSLPALRALYLWQTNVTEAGVENLKQALPKVDVNLGLTLTPTLSEDAEEENAE